MRAKVPAHTPWSEAQAADLLRTAQFRATYVHLNAQAFASLSPIG